MDEEIMENVNRSMNDDKVSPEFRRIANYFCMRYGLYESDSPYIPSLVDIQYLFDHIIKRDNSHFLRLTNMILTVETGSYLGDLLNSSRIREILFGDIGDGELALMRKVKVFIKFNFSKSEIRFDRIESLVNALNKSVFLDFSYNDITVDGMRVILKVLKENLKESKRFNCTLQWNQTFDINELGLDELLDCVEILEMQVHDYDSDYSRIEINNISEVNSFLRVYVNCTYVGTDEINKFLNQNKNKNWIVEVFENYTECFLLMPMINIIKELLPTSFKINCSTEEFIGQEKLNEIMEGLVETNLIDLKIGVSDLTGDDFETIIDKTKSMKLQRLELHDMKMIDFNFQTVVEPFGFSRLQCLSIDKCELNGELTKILFSQLEHSKLGKFSISGTNLSNTFDYSMLVSLICSNVTSLELKCCQLSCEHVRMIAESLKNSKITSLNLTGNRINNVGVKAIADVVKQTKLNSLILDENSFNGDGVIELLKLISKTKITICSVNSFKSNNREYEAIANILKDNKILLKFIGNGRNDKIDEFLERNNNLLVKAKLIISKFQKDTLLYHYKYKKYFEAYESFVDTDVLWTNINDEQSIKLKLKNNIKDSYMKICGVINDKLEVINDNSRDQINFSNLSQEILNKIFSYLSLSDVKS